MEELKNLYQQQLQALKMGNMIKLSEINKKIFTIREQIRKQKKLERQQKNETAINKKIEQILT